MSSDDKQKKPVSLRVKIKKIHAGIWRWGVKNLHCSTKMSEKSSILVTKKVCFQISFCKCSETEGGSLMQNSITD